MPYSPTSRLLAGLAVTLAAVGGFSWYTLRQIDGLRRLQTDIVDRSRRDSLQLLRIQNDLHALGLAMRDMTEGAAPYPLAAWKNEFARHRADLADALRQESELAPVSRTPEQQKHLADSLARFWLTVDRVFASAEAGRERDARALITTELQSQQAAITATVARLLVMNNEAEELAVQEIQAIYDRVSRNIYFFVAGVLGAIAATSLYLIHSNRRLFRQLASLTEETRVLARKLIHVQEEVLRGVSRELHDEFGQILTAVGAMLTRAEKQGLPPDSPFRTELQEVRQITQAALDNTRGLAQTLHPTILDDYGLEKALEWFVERFEKQTGIAVRYEKEGDGAAVGDETATHVFRIVQEALNNVARHAQARSVQVRVRFAADGLRLEVEDDGVGVPHEATRNGAGLGLVAMRERAEILHGRLDVRRRAAGGTLVALEVPLAGAPAA
jgi:signal transduction histidine kinase